jgi:hypothetical protein
LERKESVPKPLKVLDYTNVCVISHGYSPTRGPDYALIRVLQSVAVKHGFFPVIPDFIDSYTYGTSRGRSERVRRIYEVESTWCNRSATTSIQMSISSGVALSPATSACCCHGGALARRSSFECGNNGESCKGDNQGLLIVLNS